MSSSNVKAALLELEAASNSQRFRVGVGVDGSDVAKKAFELASRFVQKSRKDRLFCLHIAPYKGKVSTPLQKAEFLQSEFERLGNSLKVESTFYAREKREHEETVSALVGLVKELTLDIVVLGSYGRSGERMGVIGSTADGSLRDASCSVCVVKSSSFALVKNTVYMVATDNSRASQLAFSMLVSHLARPGDVVHVIMCHTDASQAAVLQAYKEVLQERKIEGTCNFLFDPAAGTGKNVGKIIMEQSEKLQADLIVMGLANFASRKLGSVSEEVVKDSKVSILLIKDPIEQKERLLVNGKLT